MNRALVALACALVGCGGSSPPPVPTGQLLLEDFCPAPLSDTYTRCYFVTRNPDGY